MFGDINASSHAVDDDVLSWSTLFTVSAKGKPSKHSQCWNDIQQLLIWSLT